jgi:excisionase family DNA binding protein
MSSAEDWDGQDWLKPIEAGRQLGVTSTRVKQLIAEGKLDAVKTRLGRLIDPASVDREQRRRGGGRGG